MWAQAIGGTGRRCFLFLGETAKDSQLSQAVAEI
jgi:hypothetical protein